MTIPQCVLNQTATVLSDANIPVRGYRTGMGKQLLNNVYGGTGIGQGRCKRSPQAVDFESG